MSDWFRTTTRDESKTLGEVRDLEKIVQHMVIEAMMERDLTEETIGLLDEVLASLHDCWPNYVAWQERIDEHG